MLGMLGLFIDTSTWLDIAGRVDGQKVIAPLRVLKHQGKLELFVPAVVVEEFERNRPTVESTVRDKVHGRFRELRADIRRLAGAADRQNWLEAMSYHLPLVSAGALQNFSEVAALLRGGRTVEPMPADYARVVQRGLAKRAPFHQSKNSVADALLIEMYGSLLQDCEEAIDQYCFATSNYKDFSLPNGDRHLPHADLAEFFTGGSRYAYAVEGVVATLADYFGDEFHDEVAEVELATIEPRSLAEIIEAEQEFFDKVWYVRKLILMEKIEAGEENPSPPDIAEAMDAAMREIEARYGAEDVGPWDDWGWGFVHGKLSALRWVLGAEWDFLDT